MVPCWRHHTRINRVLGSDVFTVSIQGRGRIRNPDYRSHRQTMGPDGCEGPRESVTVGDFDELQIKYRGSR